MTRHRKTLRSVLSGASDANVRFVDLCRVLLRWGFGVRVRGDHHIFTRDDVVEIINLQPRSGKAKPYQVKQVRQLFEKYHFEETDDASL